jgi:hypothetical protein
VKRALLCQVAALAVSSLIGFAGVVALLMKPIDVSPLAPVGATVPLSLLEQPPMLEQSAAKSGTLSAILARPVFSKTRRPFQPPPLKLPAPASPPAESFQPQAPAADALLLRGIALRSGQAKALIVSPSHPAGIWIETGSDIEGWRLHDVASNSASLARGASAIELRLYPDAPDRGKD